MGVAPSHIYYGGYPHSPISSNWDSNIYENEFSSANIQQFGETTKLIKEDNPDGFSFPHELVQL